jgi:hypothetical protein
MNQSETDLGTVITISETRSALRRQPGSPELKETSPNSRRNARQQRAFLIQQTVSWLPNFASGGGKLPKVSDHMPKYSQFWETPAGDWV